MHGPTLSRSTQIQRLLNLRSSEAESIENWCKCNGIEESVLYKIIETYAWDRRSAAAAIEAFRLGYDLCRDEKRDVPGEVIVRLSR